MGGLKWVMGRVGWGLVLLGRIMMAFWIHLRWIWDLYSGVDAVI